MLAEFPLHRRSVAAWLGVSDPLGRGGPVIYLVPDLAAMRRRVGAGVPDWAAGVARPDDVIAIRLDRVDRTPADRLERVLVHEVVHLVLNHVGGQPLPRWFEEGLCVYRAGQPFLQADYTVERLAAGGNLPSLEEAERGFSGDSHAAAVAYQVGHEAVLEFLRRFGSATLRRMLAEMARGVPFESAFRLVTGTTPAEFEQQFRERVTPKIPFLLYILLQNLEVSLLALGGVVIAIGYVRWRLRRERAMASLDLTPDD